MRYVEAHGARLSAIGLGTWQFGSREWGYGSDYANTEAVAIVHRAIELGINLIDTAEIYGFGRSERIVGGAIAGRRDDVFVATKVFPLMPLAPIVEQRGRASARRLKIEPIDLYQVHWPNPVVPIGTTMEGIRRLQHAGVVTHAGVSNFDLAKWQTAESALGSTVLTNQVQFSLVQRKPERDLVPWAQQTGHVAIAYSPLAQGFLGAKYDASSRPGGVRAGNSLFLPENLDRAQPLFAALRETAAAHGATPAQVALAWLIRKPNVVAIPGASSVSQLESNAAAADIELSDEQNDRLTAASDAFHPTAGAAALPQLLRARLSR